jgi:hypothetical protein
LILNGGQRRDRTADAGLFSDEALVEFAQRAGGIKMSEDRQILDMMIRRKTGEITFNLTDERYAKVELVGGGPSVLRFVILRHPFQFLGQPRVFG